MIPDAAPGGRPRKADKREILGAIPYILQAGCAWRLLPHDFPTRQTVCYYLRRWQREAVLARIRHRLVLADREKVATPCPRRPDRPDGRSKGGFRGYGAGNWINVTLRRGFQLPIGVSWPFLMANPSTRSARRESRTRNELSDIMEL